MGAYLSTAAPGIPTILHGLMLSGVYDIPAIKEDVYGVYTNTHAGRGVSRRRAARSDLYRRADDGQAGGDARNRPGGRPAEELHSADSRTATRS